MNQFIDTLNELGASWSHFVWHSSWQSALLSALVVVVALTIRQLPVTLRYSLLVIALIKFTVPPFFASPTGVFSSLYETRPATHVAMEQGPESQGVTSPELESANIAAIADTNEFGINPDDPTSDYPEHESTDNSVPSVTLPPNQIASNRGSDMMPNETVRRLDPPQSELQSKTEPLQAGSLVSGDSSVERKGSTLSPSVLTFEGWFLLVHLAGCCTLIVFLTIQHVKLWRLRACCVDVEDQRVLDRFRTVCTKLGLWFTPKLMLSTAIDGPICFGCLRPVVILPKDLVDRHAFSEIAMAHELAHIRRLDPWINGLQNLMLVVWWFNPMIWILNRQIRKLREDCCDDLVLVKGFSSDEAYSQTLIEIARVSTRQFTGPVSTAFGMADHPLKSRIQRIMNPKIRRYAGVTWFGGCLLLLLSVILLPGISKAIEKEQETYGEVTEYKELIASDSEKTNAIGRVAIPVVSNQDETNETRLVKGSVDGNSRAVAGLLVEAFRIEKDHDLLNIKSRMIASTKCDEQGKFEFTVNMLDLERKLSSPSESYSLIFRDPEDGELLGGQSVSLSGLADFYETIDFTGPFSLFEFNSADLTVVDSTGQPIEGVEVSVLTLGALPYEEVLNFFQNARPTQSTMRCWIPQNLSEKTVSNQQGQIRLDRVPEGGTVVAKFKLPNGTCFSTQFDSRVKQIQLDSPASSSGRIVVDEPGLDFNDVRIWFCLDNSSSINKNYISSCSNIVSVQPDGSFFLPHSAEGNHVVSVLYENQRYFWGKIDDVQLRAGVQSKIPDIHFRKGVPVRGRLIDDAGNGVPGAYINMSAVNANGEERFWWPHEKTDASGAFKTYAPRALLSLHISNLKSHLAPNPDDAMRWENFDTTTGEQEYELPAMKLSMGKELQGIVVDPKGSPVKGAIVSQYRADSRLMSSVKSDEHGQFKIKGLLPDALLSLRAIADNRVTNGIQVVDMTKEDVGELKLVVSKDHAFQLAGQIVDLNDKSIVNAKITVHRMTRLVSRSGQSGGYSTTAGDYKTDEDGRFKTSTMYPGDSYHVVITAPDIVPMTLASVIGVAGEVHDYGMVHVQRADTKVTGIVVDNNRRPVVGATVFNVGDAPTPVESKTDNQGRFSLSGIPEGSFYLFVRINNRITSTFLDRASDSIRIELDSAPESGSPQLLPYTIADRHKIARYALQQLHDLPAEKRAAIDAVITRYMARIDPKLALQWAGEPGNEQYRNDVMIEAASALIHDSPEEALALISQADAGSLFYRVFQIAEQSKDRNPELAARLAEDLAQRVEKIEAPNQVYPIAMLASLLKQIGEEEAAQGFAERAYSMAESLAGEEYESYLMGATAEQLANFDLDRSLKLIEKMKDTQGTSKDRHLGNLAATIARTNPQRAIEIASNLSDGHIPRIAFEIASVNVDAAEKFVSNLEQNREIRNLTVALIAMAQACHHQHPDLAEKFLNRALGYCMSQHHDFDSWINFGCESTPAGWAVAIGSKISVKDSRSLITKALASRRGAGQGNRLGEIYPLKGKLKMAKYIALADRNEATNILLHFERHSKLLGEGGYDTLDFDHYLLGWCLSDHDRAKQEIDKYLAEQLNREGGLRQSKFTRILGILSATSEEQFYSELSQSDALWYPGRE